MTIRNEGMIHWFIHTSQVKHGVLPKKEGCNWIGSIIKMATYHERAPLLPSLLLLFYFIILEKGPWMDKINTTLPGVPGLPSSIAPRECNIMPTWQEDPFPRRCIQIVLYYSTTVKKQAHMETGTLQLEDASLLSVHTQGFNPGANTYQWIVEVTKKAISSILCMEAEPSDPSPGQGPWILYSSWNRGKSQSSNLRPFHWKTLRPSSFYDNCFHMRLNTILSYVVPTMCLLIISRILKVYVLSCAQE